MSQVIEKAIAGTLERSHRAIIITGRSQRMQDFAIASLAEMGFCKEDMVILEDKIKVYW